MTFAHPAYLLLILLAVPLTLWYARSRHRNQPAIRVANTSSLPSLPPTRRTQLIHLPFVLRMLALVVGSLILARPQSTHPQSQRETQGIDIMLAMDISLSMLTPDLEPNRIEAAKQVANQFIRNRPNDNIGLTLFGGEAFTQCPLTTDHKALISTLIPVSCDLQGTGAIAPGTAIGMGLMSAVSKLAKSPSTSKVVILLTDGANNAGEIDPLSAAEVAQQKGVRVYTIAVGQHGNVEQPVGILPNGEYEFQTVKSDMDTTTLRAIATLTGGQHYEATTKGRLREIYAAIDQMERTKLLALDRHRRNEAYAPFALALIVLLGLEILLRLTWLRRIP